MLITSLALHVCVAGGIALSYFHWPAEQAKAPDELPPSAMVLHSEEPPPLPLLAPVKLVPVPPVVMSQPVVLPPITPKKIEQAMAEVMPAAKSAPVVEANPNANVKVLPTEAVLSPTPPPQLDGTKGIVFVLDISGSMYEPYAGSSRLAFAREALSQRILALKEGTPFAIILYAQKAYASGPLVTASDATREAAIRFIQRDVDCGGGTNLPAGFAAAAQLHAGSLVLATDGDLNITAYSLTARTKQILGPEGHCPELTVIAIAPRLKAGDDRLLQTLADVEGGSYLAELASGDSSLLSSADGTTKPAAQ
jgi:hypothetical protein